MHDTRLRCPWAGSELMAQYHDEEWGVPVHDDRLLFEILTLEGAQAGLSWDTVLKKREGYRAGFHGFDIERVAQMSEDEALALLADPGVVRHRGKLLSVPNNARRVLEVQAEFGSLDAYLWSFVGGKTIRHQIRDAKDYQATSPESDAMSKALKKRGFVFVGSTICYAFLQAVGMVDDHSDDCWRRTES